VRKKAEGILAKASKGKPTSMPRRRRTPAGKARDVAIAQGRRYGALGTAVPAPVDTVVGPIELPASFVLARVNRIRFPEALPLSQVRDRVVEQIRHEKGKDMAVVKAYEALPKAAASKSVKATATAFGVPVLETGWVGAEGAPGLPLRWSRRAAAPLGEVAPVKTLGTPLPLPGDGKGGFPRPPLSEVRDKVAAEVAARKRRRRHGGAAAGPRGIEHGGGTRNEREESGLSSSSRLVRPLSEPVPSRSERPATSGRNSRPLRESAGLAEGVPGTEGISRRAFSGEQLPSDAEWAQKKADLLKGVAEQKKRAVLEAFLSDRRRSAKVEIHPEALK